MVLKTQIMTADKMQSIEKINQAAKPSKNKTRIFKLIGGIALIIVGVILTLESPENIYYGLVWLGSEFFLFGLAEYITNKKQEEKKLMGRIITHIICAGIATAITLLFMLVMSNLNIDYYYEEDYYEEDFCGCIEKAGSEEDAKKCCGDLNMGDCEEKYTKECWEEALDEYEGTEN